jgi:hypothetical protein
MIPISQSLKIIANDALQSCFLFVNTDAIDVLAGLLELGGKYLTDVPAFQLLLRCFLHLRLDGHGHGLSQVHLVGQCAG